MSLRSHATKYRDKDKKRIFLYIIPAEISRNYEKSDSRFCEICKREQSLSKFPSCATCGKRVCLLCSSNYYIPHELHSENIDGLGKICLICRDQFLLIKQQQTAEPANLRPYRNLERAENGKIHFLPPEVWAPKDAYKNCFQCGRHLGKKNTFHNCRVCGELVDNFCSIKMAVPKCFERKGYKISKSKQRVCLDCRFYIVNGIDFSENTNFKRKEFSSYEVKKEWKNRVAGNKTLGTETLFPREINLFLENERIFPEVPKYEVKSNSLSAKSPDVKTSIQTTTLVEGNENSQSVLIINRIELLYEKNKNGEEEKKAGEGNKISSSSPFENFEVKKEKNDFDLVLDQISRKSTLKKLRKVDQRKEQVREPKYKDVVFEELKSRLDALEDKVSETVEEDEEDWV